MPHSVKFLAPGPDPGTQHELTLGPFPLAFETGPGVKRPVPTAPELGPREKAPSLTLAATVGDVMRRTYMHSHQRRR